MSNQPKLADEQMTTAGPPHTPQPVAWRYSDGVSPRFQQKRNWVHEISSFRSGVKASEENIQQYEQFVQACSSTDDAVFDYPNKIVQF
jgi:hypothetical protein